MFDKTGQGF